MKIAIYADPVMGKGGGSKVTIELANSLNADIITAGFDNKLRDSLKKNLKVIDIGNATIRRSHPLGFLFEAPIRFIFCKDYGYDVNIFIGNFSILAAKQNKENIWLCFTPNRMMYDLKKWKLQNASLSKKLIYKLHILLFRQLDQYFVKNRFTTIVAQTKTVQKRIKKYYNKNSQIIFSPIETSNYHFRKFGDYFLSVSRLVPEKRMTLIAQAFTKMESKKLILVGTGPEKEDILKIIKNSPNISLLQNVGNKELKDLYSGCLATIYMPINEDFGLVPLEGMASGKACIAADEGGCKETIINNKTGFLIEANEENIIHKINTFTLEIAEKMKNDCLLQAKKFDIQECIKSWTTLLENKYYVKSN